MNDSDVKQVSFKTVMQQSAYMLFYVRDAAVSVSSNPVISPVPVKAAIPPKRKEHIQRDFMITPPLSPVLLNQPVAAMPVTLKKDVRPSQLAQKEEKAMTPKTPKESPKKAEKKVQISAASLLDEFMDLGSAPSPKKVSKPIVEKSLPVSPKPEPVAIPMPDARPVLTPNTLAKKQKPSKKCQKMCNATDAWIVETFAALDKTPSKKLSDEDKTVKAVSQKTWKIEETPVKQTGDDNVTPKRERSDSHTHSVETHVASSGGDRSTSLFLNNGLSSEFFRSHI